MKSFFIILFLFALSALTSCQNVSFDLSGSCVAYDSIPTPLPPYLLPQYYQNSNLTEYGQFIRLKNNQSVEASAIGITFETSALYSNWSQEYPAEGFNGTITLRIYEGNQVNATYATVENLLYNFTFVFTHPWRPEPNGSCPYNQWRDKNGYCRGAMAYIAIFDFESSPISLPNQFIYSIEYQNDYAPLYNIAVGLNPNVYAGSPVIMGSGFYRRESNPNSFVLGWSNGRLQPGVRIISNTTC
jgi:hypothetical protein